MHTKLQTTFAALVLAAFGTACHVGAESVNKAIPAPAVDTPAAEAKGLQKAVLAGGCFWGLQGVYQRVQGVTKVVAGYSGGTKETANYAMVTTETTGHAEAVEITFDPRKVTYGQLLQLYFSIVHDPTQLNRQGPDTGPSYRSEIFFLNPSQEKVAKAYVAQLGQAKIYSKPIVTKVNPIQAFYAAEDYHQDFLVRNPTHPYIVRNDLPKVEALKQVYPKLYREQPVLLTTAR